MLEVSNMESALCSLLKDFILMMAVDMSSGMDDPPASIRAVARKDETGM